MASKSKKPSAKKPSKPVASAPAGTKERKPRKPPLERAIRLANSLVKKTPALQNNVASWKGEPTAEQRMAQVRTVNNLKKVVPLVDQIVGDLAYLRESGYAPTTEHLGGRAKSFPVGATVALKAKRYEAVIHGPVNAFTITGETEKYFQIRATAKGSLILGVPRGWLEKLAIDAEFVETNEGADEGADSDLVSDQED